MVIKKIGFPSSLIAAVDEARGDVPFAAFVRRAVEARLIGSIRVSLDLDEAQTLVAVSPHDLSKALDSVPEVPNTALGSPVPWDPDPGRVLRERLGGAPPFSSEPSVHLLADSVAEVVDAALGDPPLPYLDAAPAILEAALSGSLPPIGAKRKATPRRRASSEDKDCTHPVTRRIGSACGLCGEKVKA